jgi:UDP-N-acetylglucosamine/UDP-N-acetylgalactosamine diphosphorylase
LPGCPDSDIMPTNHPLSKQLAAAGQEHVLGFYAELKPAAREQLDRQLQALDLDVLDQLTHNARDAPDWSAMAHRATPPPAIRLDDRDAAFITPAAARRAGEAALRGGRVGAILVAGGQGTRLAFAHPKGMFPIGPVSGHSLFQILIEKVVATARRYNTSVPLYVMTSPATHEETIAYLASHQRFGLPAEDLRIFCQGTMPAVDAVAGKLILATKDSLALAPDGHGGMLEALCKSGALQHARDRHITLFSYGQIDNPLLQLCHPELIGYHLLAESEMTTQVIRKVDPFERVGNVVMVDGKMHIIEYSDLPQDVAQLRNPDDTLYVWAGSIAVHVFDAAFLQRISHQADALPFHRAQKKVPFVDAQGVAQTPDQPNALKFERFIFDLLPWARNTIVVEGNTAEVFAPVKNAEGAPTDTPAATKNALTRLHTQWLRQAGAHVKHGTLVEISPLWALDAEQVAQRVKLPCTIDQPTFLSPESASCCMP